MWVRILQNCHFDGVTYLRFETRNILFVKTALGMIEMGLAEPLESAPAKREKAIKSEHEKR